MENVQMHESLNGVIDNGDGTFTITRNKLISLVQGQVFSADASSLHAGDLRNTGRSASPKSARKRYTSDTFHT